MKNNLRNGHTVVVLLLSNGKYYPVEEAPSHPSRPPPPPQPTMQTIPIVLDVAGALASVQLSAAVEGEQVGIGSACSSDLHQGGRLGRWGRSGGLDNGGSSRGGLGGLNLNLGGGNSLVVAAHTVF